MRRIAYIDHSYHQKTLSTQFFVDLIRELGLVDVFWDESWNGGLGFDLAQINSEDYELVVFFQIMVSRETLDQLKCKRVLLVPMYDNVGDTSVGDWIQYRSCFVVSFAKTVHRAVRRSGTQSFLIQYFQDPQVLSNEPEKDFKKVFFWERTEEFTARMVEDLFGSDGRYQVHHHVALDPGRGRTVSPPPNWTSSSWFERQEDYEKVVASCGIFVAPRKREGIGMGFIEAMARGMVVVGFDYPTLSEYVRNKKSGVLLSEKKFCLPPHINWSAVGLEARKVAEEGYLVYQKRLLDLKTDLERFLVTGSPGSLTGSYIFFSLRVWVVKKIKDGLRPLKRRLVGTVLGKNRKNAE